MNFKSPPKLKKVMAFLFRLVSKKLSFLWSAGAEKSHEGWVQNAHKDRLIYQNSGFDVLLCPAFAMPAAPNKLCSRLLPAASYTCVYNLVGCPAGIVPVTRLSSLSLSSSLSLLPLLSLLSLLSLSKSLSPM